VLATREDLMRVLAGLGISVNTVEHPPLFTVEQSRALRGEIPGAHTKNLFLKDKRGALFLVTTSEEAIIDLKHIHHRIGASGRVSFGNPTLLMDTLGVPPGAVTPFGVINDTEARVTVVLDSVLVTDQTINCHPLENTATTSIATTDLLAFLRAMGHEPRIVSLSSP
jgi:Ala-tRNA(Pro) deacylase